jgi:hypothetical protein
MRMLAICLAAHERLGKDSALACVCSPSQPRHPYIWDCNCHDCGRLAQWSHFLSCRSLWTSFAITCFVRFKSEYRIMKPQPCLCLTACQRVIYAAAAYLLLLGRSALKPCLILIVGWTLFFSRNCSASTLFT